MIKHIFALVLLVCLSYQARASHAMGGEITWTCQGGDYVFELTFYRDCNSTAPLNPVSETIKVWGHPTVTQFDVDFISRTDISPICTEVAGGPSAFVCGSGPGSGNGVGAIEKAIYRSQPISLPGTPPVGGWIFTFDNFARSNAITNLVDPSTRGLTIHSTMYAIPGAPGGCVDNSPQLLQDPYFVSCVGEPYSYNMNAVDEDLDSLFITFGKPLNHILGATYNPPTDPYEIPFESGFSYDSPTPGTGMNASNIPASINASSGTLDFLSFNSGVFTVKLTIQSFRDGVLIAEVNREMQLVVSNCSGSNNAPTIAGPFGGTFETTINAGDLVNFDLNATDVELLQDGSPQNNHLSATGLMFGTNYTDPNSGCINTPCATLNATPLITMQQGVTTTFNWQTTCDHLIGAGGVELDLVPYHFVFKVQDDYCDVPKVSYATVTVNVVNQGIIPAPGIDCIQSNALGDVTINWTPVPDPFGTFTAYEVHSVQSGLLATLGAIGSSSYTDPGVTQQNDYFVVVRSGCNGGSFRSSDTISNIFLDD